MDININKKSIFFILIGMSIVTQSQAAVYEARYKLERSSFDQPGKVNPPELQSIQFNPSIINEGQSTTLSWAGTGVKYVNVIGNGAPSGNLTSQNIIFTPLTAGSYNYVVNAYNSKSESVSQQASLEVVPNPTITSFTVDRSSISEGESVIFSWAGNGTEFKLNGNPVTGNSATVMPPNVGNNNYTLSAYNKLGTEIIMQKQVNVIAALPPVLTSMTTSKNFLETGFPVTLNWSGTNVSKYSLYDNSVLINDNLSGSSLTLSPSVGNHAYSLRAYNTKGDYVSMNRNVSVTGAPVITQFYPNAGTYTKDGVQVYAITAGETLYLNYSIDNYSIIKMNGVTTSSYYSYNTVPTAKADYTLQLTGNSGTVVSKTVSVDVVPKAKIVSFTTDKTSYKDGENIVFTWNVTDASSILVDYGYVTGNTTTIKARVGRVNQKFDIIVSNVLGNQVLGSVTINVVP